MFRIWKETQDDEGNNVNKSIQVKNQKYLEEHLLNMGIGLTKVNFFSYNALPDRSYGVFIVSEEEWIAEMPDISGDIKLNLTIEDQYAFKVFKDLSVVRTAFIMSPIAPGAAQDNRRLLLIELELDRDYYHSVNPLSNGFSTWESLKLEFHNGDELEDPDVFENNFASNDAMLMDVLAYIADVNFLTLYLDPEVVSAQPKLTKEAFDPTSINVEARLLYNDVTFLENPPKFNIYMFPSAEGACTAPEQLNETITISDITEITVGNEDKSVYESPVNSNSTPDNFVFEIAYSRIDAYKKSVDTETAQTFVNDFADVIKVNGTTRFSCSYDLIYEGVVNVGICNDLHHIDYYFGEFGLRTRLRTKQWNPDESILIPKNIPCEDKIFKALTVQNWPSAGTQGSEAIIFRMKQQNAAQVIVDASAYITAPLSIFKWYAAGTWLLVYKACDNCEYFVIQGPCPPSSPVTAPGEIGKCCKELDATTSYCYEIAESECNAIGGTWSVGDCIPDRVTACFTEQPQ